MSVPNVLISSLFKHGQLGGLYSARDSSQSGPNNVCHIENSRNSPSLEQPALPTLFALMVIAPKTAAQTSWRPAHVADLRRRCMPCLDQRHGRPKNPRARRSARLTLSAFLFIMAFTLIEHATSPLTIAASTSASFVQAAASAAHGTPTTLSLPFPSNTQSGDFLLIAFDHDTNATPTSVTDSQGNVFAEVGSQLSTPGGTLSRVYYAKNIKGGADTVTVTLSASSSYLELYLNEYSGINTTNPIDAEVGASGSAGAASSGDATTTVAGDIIYGFCIGDGVCTVGSGFTARSTLDGNLIEDETAGTAGSYAATGSATSGWTMQMVALKPASTAVVAPPAITSATTASGTVGGSFSY